MAKSPDKRKTWRHQPQNKQNPPSKTTFHSPKRTITNIAKPLFQEPYATNKKLLDDFMQVINHSSVSTVEP